MKLISYICFLLLQITLISCKQRKKLAEGEYRMQTYFSKAEVDTSAFPLFKVYPDHHFDMILRGRVTGTGGLVFYDDGFDFKINNGPVLRAYYTANDSLIQIRNIIALSIEAKTADYILIKSGL